MLTQYRLFALFVVLLATLFLTACGEPETVEVTKEVIVEVTPVPAAKEVIVFSDLNWTSAQVQNRIAQYPRRKGLRLPDRGGLWGDAAAVPGSAPRR